MIFDLSRVTGFNSLTGVELPEVNEGLPNGGTTGQVLAKTSNTDYDVAWVTGSGGPTAWGGITGTLSDQTDLNSALGNKENTGVAASLIAALDKTSVGLANVDNTSDANKPVSLATQAELDLKQPNLTGFNNALFYQVTANDIQPIPNWAINPLQGLTQTPAIIADLGGGESVNNFIMNIDHDVVAPNKNYNVHYNRINADVTATGNALGTNGRYATFINNDFFHDTVCDIGEISFISNVFNIGQTAAAPINANGFSYAYGFGQVRDNVTVLGAMQGYGFQPSFDAGSQVDNNTYLAAFYDATFAPDTNFASYTSVNLSPNVGGIQNNRNMASININPQVGEFFGNAGYQGVGIFGTLGDFDTGSYQGVTISPVIGTLSSATMINVNPTITMVDNATGLDINMSNVTGTNILAARFTGDVQINGALSFSGALSMGQLNAFYATNPVDGFGQPQNMHTLITSMTALNAITTANVDTIGVNTAMLITLEADSINTSGGFQLGFASLVLPAAVTTHTNSYLEHLNLAVLALNLDGASTGGTIGRVNGARIEAIPNGITTINEFVAFEFNQLFGQVGTDVWGVHIVPTYAQNYFGGSINIGNATRKVTNSDIGLEIGNKKAFRCAVVTTAERDAMTAVFGMEVANVTVSKKQFYDGTVWVDLH